MCNRLSSGETRTWSTASVVAGMISNQNEQTLTFPQVTLEPHTRTKYVYSQFQGALKALPYSATVEVTFTDGTNWTQVQSGEYAGTSYLSLDSYYTGYVKNVTSCV